MRIFALETDRQKIIQRFCHEDECIILLTYFHWFSFVAAILGKLFVTAMIGVACAAVIYFGASPLWSIVGAFGLWVGMALPGLLKAYIDWKYDFILVTTDKIILVDQTSIFKQEIKPIHIENIGSVSMHTQWWGIFDFGAIHLNLKEGEGGIVITRRYVPNVREVVSKMSSVVTNFQRGDFEQNMRDRSRLPLNKDQRVWTAHAQIDHQLEQKRARIDEIKRETQWEHMRKLNRDATVNPPPPPTSTSAVQPPAQQTRPS